MFQVIPPCVEPETPEAKSLISVYFLLVAIRIMPAWKWLEFKDFIVDFENKKDCYTVGDVLGTLCTGLHKPVLRIVPKNE